MVYEMYIIDSTHFAQGISNISTRTGLAPFLWKILLLLDTCPTTGPNCNANIASNNTSLYFLSFYKYALHVLRIYC